MLKQLRIKPTRQLMRFAWGTETMVLPYHKVTIQELSSREELRTPVQRLTLIEKKGGV